MIAGGIIDSIEDVAQRTPAADRVAAVSLDGALCVAAGGPVSPDAGRAIVDLWRTAERAARDRSPSPLDHLVMKTTIGGLAIVRCGDGLVAAVAREGARPDRLAYELRRAAADLCPGGAGVGVGS